jgi:hypothetical protein
LGAAVPLLLAAFLSTLLVLSTNAMVARVRN